MKYNAEVLDHQYKAVLFFIQHLAYYRVLQAAYGGIADHREFWRSTCDAHLKLATVAWCNVFGTYSEELHWTKTPADSIAQQAQQDFRRRILSSTGLAQDQWKTYHDEVVDFRNRFVSHNNAFGEPVPVFDSALQVACLYQAWVKELIKASADKFAPVIWGDPAFVSRYEEWKAEAFSIVRPEANQ
jgi:hypothetical protein